MTAANEDLDSIKIDISKGKDEIEQLNHKKRHLEGLIARTQGGAGYEKIKGLAEASARRILRGNKIIVKAAFSDS